MSLVDGAEPATAAAVALFVSELKAGSREDRAVLLNLREEDRVPGAVRVGFHASLAAVSGTCAERLGKACKGGSCALPVDGSERHKIAEPWSVYATLTKLQSSGYASDAAVDPSEAPPRVALKRPFGRASTGAEYPFWITTVQGGDADEVRDRLGLAHIPSGEVLYRVGVTVDASRPVHIPSALDAGYGPPWRRPPRKHAEPWGLTRDLRSDEPREPELLTRPSDTDPRSAEQIGLLGRSPSIDYLKVRVP